MWRRLVRTVRQYLQTTVSVPLNTINRYDWRFGAMISPHTLHIHCIPPPKSRTSWSSSSNGGRWPLPVFRSASRRTVNKGTLSITLLPPRIQRLINRVPVRSAWLESIAWFLGDMKCDIPKHSLFILRCCTNNLRTTGGYLEPSYHFMYQMLILLLWPDLWRHRWPWGQQSWVLLEKFAMAITCRLGLIHVLDQICQSVLSISKIISITKIWRALVCFTAWERGQTLKDNSIIISAKSLYWVELRR